MKNIDALIDTLRKCILPKESEIKQLCELATDIFAKLPNMVQVRAPVTIVGDIHGQFFDLLELFKVGGEIPETNYLFMGDIVDRGFFSVETILLLLAYKVRYPDRVTILRGNHESRLQTQTYGFYDEVIRKFGGTNVWHYCMNVFDALPLAALVEEKVFCVHGGLSPMIDHLSDIKKIDRFGEIPHEGPMCDLLWSDPEPEMESGWGLNQRGAGYVFGKDIVHKFNQVNNLILICRSHQLVMEGYQLMFDDQMVNVWSAPNYCYRAGNIASILELDENLEQTYKLFDKAPDSVRGIPYENNVPTYFL